MAFGLNVDILKTRDARNPPRIKVIWDLGSYSPTTPISEMTEQERESEVVRRLNGDYRYNEREICNAIFRSYEK